MKEILGEAARAVGESRRWGAQDSSARARATGSVTAGSDVVLAGERPSEPPRSWRTTGSTAPARRSAGCSATHATIDTANPASRQRPSHTEAVEEEIPRDRGVAVPAAATASRRIPSNRRSSSVGGLPCQARPTRSSWPRCCTVRLPPHHRLQNGSERHRPLQPERNLNLFGSASGTERPITQDQALDPVEVVLTRDRRGGGGGVRDGTEERRSRRGEDVAVRSPQPGGP